MLHWFSRLRRAIEHRRYGSVDSNAPLGRRGEQVASQLLRRKGLLVIAHGEADRLGELDLIAIDQRQRLIIFVEVKTLATREPGHPADRVDRRKQQQISRAALRFLRRKGLVGSAVRFDVIAVWWHDGAREPQRVQHFESAFEATGQFQLF